jgi:hypothetical protein
MPDLAGQTLKGHYFVKELIGRGMAEVYKTLDLRRSHAVVSIPGSIDRTATEGVRR